MGRGLRVLAGRYADVFATATRGGPPVLRFFPGSNPYESRLTV
jgi:hypothetical protein